VRVALENPRVACDTPYLYQICEQLNGWLGGFESILKRMTQTNFNWFLHVMLFYYTRQILNRQADNDLDMGDNPEFEDLN